MKKIALPYDVNLKTMVWIIAMIYLGILGILLIIRSFKAEIKSLKETQRAYAFLIYMFAIGRIFFIFSDYERDSRGDTALYFQFVLFAYICFIIGFLAVTYVLESHVITRTKHGITYIVLILLGINIIMLFFPNLVPIVRYINYGLLYGQAILIILIYLYLIINTSGRLRSKSLLIFIALIIMMLGSILDSDALIISGISSPLYNPILLAIGATMFSYAQMKE